MLKAVKGRKESERNRLSRELIAFSRTSTQNKKQCHGIRTEMHLEELIGWKCLREIIKMNQFFFFFTQIKQ